MSANDERLINYYTENPGSDPLDAAIELKLNYWDVIFALDRLIESHPLVFKDAEIRCQVLEPTRSA